MADGGKCAGNQDVGLAVPLARLLCGSAPIHTWDWGLFFVRDRLTTALVALIIPVLLERWPSAERMNAISRASMSVACRHRTGRRAINSRNFFLPTCATSHFVTHTAVRL